MDLDSACILLRMGRHPYIRVVASDVVVVSADTHGACRSSRMGNIYGSGFALEILGILHIKGNFLTMCDDRGDSSNSCNNHSSRLLFVLGILWRRRLRICRAVMAVLASVSSVDSGSDYVPKVWRSKV